MKKPSQKVSVFFLEAFSFFIGSKNFSWISPLSSIVLFLIKYDIFFLLSFFWGVNISDNNNKLFSF